MSRKTILVLLFCILCAGEVTASGSHKAHLDSFGNLNHFWLAPSTVEGQELKLAKSTLAEPQTLYAFTLEVTSFDIRSRNTRYFLAFAAQDPESKTSNLYLTYSSDAGQNFSSPLLISFGGSNPSLAVSDNLLALAWEESGYLYFIKSEDGGMTLGEPATLQITDEALSSPSLAIDSYNNLHSVFISRDKNTNLNRILYAQLLTPEAKTLFESHDDIINLNLKIIPSGLLVFWQKEYLERRESYFSISLDNGETFCQAKPFEFEKELVDFGIFSEKLSAITYRDDSVPTPYDSKLLVQEIEIPPPPTPQIFSPADSAVLNSDNLWLAYALPGEDPLLCKIDVAPDEFFYSYSAFECLTSPSLEVNQYQLPGEFADGTYFLRIYAFDGIDTSPASQVVKLRIDNTPPQIQTLEAERIERNVVLKGEISELPASLNVNQAPIPLDPNSAQFLCQFPLEPGNNLFTLVLSDEAGNLSISTREVFYDPARPEITVTKPAESEWLKPDSTIFIEAQVFDLQKDIGDETEARVMIGDTILEETLAFDPQESMLFGFVTLPPGLSEGEHAGTVILSDRDGNEGQGNFVIKIDGSPPVIQENVCFTNSESVLEIPLLDAGSGIDLSSSLIKICGVSLEGTATVEGEKITLITSTLLLEGSYEVEVIGRDHVGNVGEPVTLSLVVDTTPPRLTLIGSYESQINAGEITVQGRVEEDYPALVKVYINQNEVENFTLSGDYFSKEIKLIPGRNEILIEIHDRAGNTASASISTVANFSTSSNLITNFIHGPNPFSPEQNLPGAFSTYGKGMIFSYELSQPADIKILIFDITGTLIWSKDIKSATSGVTAWSGIDQFGRISRKGIYPYVFQATAGENREIKRGKIIVYPTP